MAVKILLSLSVIVCLIGLSFRFFIWFSQGIVATTKDSESSVSKDRIGPAVQAVIGTIFSNKLLLVAKSAIVDLLLQKRIFDKSLQRWLAHTLIFVGFMLLLLFHALGGIISESIFSDYQSTLNPFLFLRNLLGVLVLVGLALAVFRRLTLKPKRLKTSLSDWTALIFIAVIIISGMFLEGAKISSYSTYSNMVEEYAAFSDDEEEKALEAFWVAENGLSSPQFKDAPSPELVAMGMEINSDSCIECHASNKAAFASYSLAFLPKTFAAILGDERTVSMFLYLHLIACFSFLAWLPFSKMFHILAAPVSLMIKSVTGDEELNSPANVLNRQMIGLSACTHCGSCSVECSSSMFYEHFDNDFILPSEKVQYLKKFAAGKEADPQIVKQMQQGLYVCTSCDRCTTICPSGINLKEIFVHSRYGLLKEGQPEVTMLSHFSFPLALAQNFVDDHLKALKKVTDIFKERFRTLTDISTPLTLSKLKGLDNNTFKGCFSCQRCTNICPVVRCYENPSEKLGLLPHQIMYSLGIGDIDLAMGSQMIWSCSTCYLCQEHCPNEVELTDIFYSLKNNAINKIEGGASA